MITAELKDEEAKRTASTASIYGPRRRIVLWDGATRATETRCAAPTVQPRHTAQIDAAPAAGRGDAPVKHRPNAPRQGT